MPRYVPVAPATFEHKRWRSHAGYRFAAADAAVPLVGLELVRAALTMPIAFLKDGERYTLAAVLSLASGSNLFVAPDGRWLGGYIPAQLRGYPFRLLRAPGTDQLVLCVDEESGLVTDTDTTAHAFFGDDGGPSAALKPVFDFLSSVEASRRPTDLAVSALAEAGLIRPWELKVKTEQGEQPISGLHRIDEAALNALGDEQFLKLRKSGALPIAYAQMLSMGQIGIFQHLAKLRSQLKPPPATTRLPESIDSLFALPNNDMIKFQ